MANSNIVRAQITLINVEKRWQYANMKKRENQLYNLDKLKLLNSKMTRGET